MDSDQKILEEIIKTAPGFIGDTARQYAVSFLEKLRKGTDNSEEYRKAFLIIITERATVSTFFGQKEANLLLPLYIKGVDEVHRALDRIKIGDDPRYKLDLPTMALYSMLLESESLRKIFEKGDQSFYQKSLEVIHQEIKKICPYQIKFDEPEYVNIHLSLIKTFLLLHRSPRQMAAERLSSVIKDMFSGKKSNLPKGNENSSEE